MTDGIWKNNLYIIIPIINSIDPKIENIISGGKGEISDGLYMAHIRPIYGLYTAYIWPIYGLYMAYTRPIAGLYTAYSRPIYGL